VKQNHFESSHVSILFCSQEKFSYFDWMILPLSTFADIFLSIQCESIDFFIGYISVYLHNFGLYYYSFLFFSILFSTQHPEVVDQLQWNIEFKISNSSPIHLKLVIPLPFIKRWPICWSNFLYIHQRKVMIQVCKTYLFTKNNYQEIDKNGNIYIEY
jgi:hypothetical protein